MQIDDFHRNKLQLGCTVRAYDPTDKVKRPSNSYLPNLHFYPLAIGPNKGTMIFPGDKSFKMNSIGNLIKGNVNLLLTKYSSQ